MFFNHETNNIQITYSLHPVEGNIFPLTFTVSDGSDGSGTHQVYNQLQETPQFNCKIFYFTHSNPFVFEIVAILMFGAIRPNFQYQKRLVALLAAKENEEHVRHLMDTYINPFVSELLENGISLPEGQGDKVVRSMFDSKMCLATTCLHLLL